MAGRSFAPIGSRGEWPRFSNGKCFPYMLWGSTFRGASEKVISDASSSVEAVSIVALGRIEKSEIALASFGERMTANRRAAEFAAKAEELLASTPNTPGWAVEFEEPFEDFKTISRQENSGLVVVVHSGNSAESSSFGDMAPAVSAHALTAMGDLVLNEAGLGTGSSPAQQAPTAA